MRPASEETSRDTKAVSLPVDNVQWNFTTSGSASTWQCKVAGWSRDTTTKSGFERRQIGASASEPNHKLNEKKLTIIVLRILSAFTITLDMKVERCASRLPLPIGSHAAVISSRVPANMTNNERMIGRIHFSFAVSSVV